VNGRWLCKMQADRGRCRTCSQIVQIGQPGHGDSPDQRLADRVACTFVPAVILAAVATFIVWYLAGPQPRFAHAR